MAQAINRIVERVSRTQEGNMAPFLNADDIEAGYKLVEAEASEDYIEKMESVRLSLKRVQLAMVTSLRLYALSSMS